MRILFRRIEQGESDTFIHRDDGVVVVLPSYSRKHAVPHDLAHAVAEREFGLADGVFGSIAAGAMFRDMRVVTGRPRHDAAARSARILDANSPALTVAEVMAGAVHHAVEGPARTAPGEAARHDWGIVRPDPFPWSDAEVDAAVACLTELAERWRALAPGDELEFVWPDRLTRPVPVAKTRYRSGSGRRTRR